MASRSADLFSPPTLMSGSDLLRKYINSIKFRHGPGVVNRSSARLGAKCGEYEGPRNEGGPHGSGAMLYVDGSVYIGDWCQGMREGQGKLECSKGFFAGEWRNDLPRCGIEKMCGFGDTFTGGFVSGLRSGYGVMVYTDGGFYEGEWEGGRRHGAGSHALPNGISVQGNFSRDVMNDAFVATYTSPSGLCMNIIESLLAMPMHCTNGETMLSKINR